MPPLQPADSLSATTTRLGGWLLEARPSAIVCVSTHRQEPQAAVGHNPSGGLDFEGCVCVEGMYRCAYCVEGCPAVAVKVSNLLRLAGFHFQATLHREYDYEVSALGMPVYSDADIPVVHISPRSSLDVDGLCSGNTANLHSEDNILLNESASTRQILPGPQRVMEGQGTMLRSMAGRNVVSNILPMKGTVV